MFSIPIYGRRDRDLCAKSCRTCAGRSLIAGFIPAARHDDRASSSF